MKKIIALSLALVIALMLSLSCAQAEENPLVGQTFPDFSVKTFDGKTFMLSESLKTHELVVINFWATWCGPCCYEFPLLEEAWEQYADRVDVIALSVGQSDTDKVLKAFAKENGLKFSISRDSKRLYEKTGSIYIPTTVIVDQERNVLSVEVGMKNSVKQFTDLFDSLLPAPEAEEPAAEL